MGRGQLAAADRFTEVFGNRRGGKRLTGPERFATVHHDFAPNREAMLIDNIIKVYVEGETIVIVSKGSPHQHYTPQEWDEQMTQDIDVEGFVPFPPAAEILTAWHDHYDFRPM